MKKLILILAMAGFLINASSNKQALSINESFKSAQLLHQQLGDNETDPPLGLQVAPGESIETGSLQLSNGFSLDETGTLNWESNGLNKLPEEVVTPVGCPFKVQVNNYLPKSATLLKLKIRIVGLPWKILDEYLPYGEVVFSDSYPIFNYTTSSACNLTKHDLHLTFRNGKGVEKTKQMNKILITRDKKVVFKLGKE